ncbi:MAG: TIGR00282 family metallophosphoesterase [Alphaproteobacteria bacterium]
MRLLFCGDIVGRAGRAIITDRIPRLRDHLNLDLVVVNGENAAHGFGITRAICAELYAAGVDVITTGNHIWDQRETVTYITDDPCLLRPINFPVGTPGNGWVVHTTRTGEKVLVINVMGRLFMEPLEDPFAAVDQILSQYPLGKDIAAIVVDIHAEATSEKQALAHYLDGRVSLVIGTHTHVPSADGRCLSAGTAYQSDAGMCGDYDSVIGMKKSVPIARFRSKMPTDRPAPAEGLATLCGIVVDTHPETGLAIRLEPIRLGGCLSQYMPCFDYPLAAD